MCMIIGVSLPYASFFYIQAMPKLVAASLSHDEFHKLKQQASKTTKDVESEVEKVEHFQTPSYGVPWFDDKVGVYIVPRLKQLMQYHLYRLLTQLQRYLYRARK